MMKATGWRHIGQSLAIVLALMGAWVSLSAETLVLRKTIPLPNVSGRIDHFAFDVDGQRLFVAALGNNTVEVVDFNKGTVVHSIVGLAEPQGLAFVSEFNSLYVANGGDGTLRIFNTVTFASVAVLKFADDADNLRYDPKDRKVYIGYGDGAIGIVDAEHNTIVGNIPVSAHPESFQLEKEGNRLFVNIPGSHHVAVLDRLEKKQVGKWSIGFAAANFPMGLDEVGQRAFVGCRVPARLLVFDLKSGKEIAKLDLHGDCDDVYYDSIRKQIYASCGEGFIDVFSQAGADHYVLKEAVKSAGKARTCYFDGKMIYLAVPQDKDVAAQIRCYEVGF